MTDHASSSAYAARRGAGFWRELALLSWLVLILAAGDLSAHAQPVRQVAPTEDLAQIAARAAPGTVLMLEGGDHGQLSLRDVTGTPEAPITLRALDPADPPVLTGLRLERVAHMTFSGLTFDYRFAPEDPVHLRPFRVMESEHIIIADSLFDGDLRRDGNDVVMDRPTGFGLSVTDSRNITVMDNEIRRFHRAMVFTRSDELLVRGNDIHTIRSDGLNFAAVTGVRIEGNVLRDLLRALGSEDHADLIQFWTNRTDRPNKDIVIRGNLLNAGTSDYSQSIFMRNEEVDRGRAGDEMFYRDIVIEQNVIINAHLHGITLGEADGVIIRNNTLIHSAQTRMAHRGQTASVRQPRISVNQASRNVTIKNNIAPRLSLPDAETDWVVEGNILVQDQNPNAAHFYDDLFVAARHGDPRDLASFFYAPHGPLAASTSGALLLSDTPEGAEARARLPVSDRMRAPQIIARPAPGGRMDLELRPGALDGDALPEGAEISWDLGDGQHATGPTVSHVYDRTGTYEVRAAMRLAGGRVLHQTSQIRIPEAVTVQAGLPEDMIPAGAAPGTVRIGRDGPSPALSTASIRPLSGAPNVDLALRVQLDQGPGNAGQILEIPHLMRLSVTERGVLELWVRPHDAAPVRLTSPPTRLIRGDWVDLRVIYASQAGYLALMVDDVVIAQTALSAPFPHIRQRGLILGHDREPMAAIRGHVSDFHLKVPPS